MNAGVYAVGVLLGLLTASCTRHHSAAAGTQNPGHSFAVAKWVNRYQGNHDLAGVIVQQFPDCAEHNGMYERRHPAMILYVFKDGRVNQNEFDPDGTITEDWWWKAKNDDPIWRQPNLGRR